MTKRVLVVFTFRSVEALLAEGGSQAWALKQANARRCTYVVCTRNRHHKDASQREEHGAAFLVGRISSIDPSPEDVERFIVRFDRYALLNVQPTVWPGARNPIWYVNDLNEIGIDEESLEWRSLTGADGGEGKRPIEHAGAVPPTPSRLTIQEAKAGLAATFGVSPDRIEITIRG